MARGARRTAEHDTKTPDVETASDGYADRFAGPVGSWMLSVQKDCVRRLLEGRAAGPLNVLEVGGGHAQLTKYLLSAGHRVTVHGSSAGALTRQKSMRHEAPGSLQLAVSEMWDLPFLDEAFDVVIGVRLLAHVTAWESLLREMMRVAKSYVIIDYAPLSSANILTPAVFWAKKLAEGNTRPYFCYWGRNLRSFFRASGFEPVATRRQFALPMGVHRSLRSAGLSRRIEAALAYAGVTRAIGSPAMLMAKRKDIDV